MWGGGKKVLDERRPTSFMRVLGSGPTHFLGAQTVGNAPGKGSTDWREKSAAHVFLLRRCLFTLSVWIQGSQTQRVMQETQGMTWLNSGILVRCLHCEGQSQTPSQRGRPGCQPRGQVGIAVGAPGHLLRIHRWQAGLKLHEHATTGTAPGPLLRKIPCLKLNALWLPSWNL